MRECSTSAHAVVLFGIEHAESLSTIDDNPRWRRVLLAQVASVGPDVKDCSKNFPRAMLYAAGMQTVINGTIHFVAAGATDAALYPEWSPGYLR